MGFLLLGIDSLIACFVVPWLLGAHRVLKAAHAQATADR